MNEDLEGASVQAGSTRSDTRPSGRPSGRPTVAQAVYLRRGLAEPGGKLPLFDRDGQRYARRTIQSCIDQGWAKPWFHNPIKPDWLICRLTEAGQSALLAIEPVPAVPPAVQTARFTRQGSGCDARRLQHLVRELVEA